MLAKLAELDAEHAKAVAGGGEKYVARHRPGVLGVQLGELGQHRGPVVAHDAYPSSLAARSVSTSVAPPPIGRIRASR